MRVFSGSERTLLRGSSLRGVQTMPGLWWSALPLPRSGRHEELGRLAEDYEFFCELSLEEGRSEVRLQCWLPELAARAGSARSSSLCGATWAACAARRASGLLVTGPERPRPRPSAWGGHRTEGSSPLSRNEIALMRSGSPAVSGSSPSPFRFGFDRGRQPGFVVILHVSRIVAGCLPVDELLPSSTISAFRDDIHSDAARRIESEAAETAHQNRQDGRSQGRPSFQRCKASKDDPAEVRDSLPPRWYGLRKCHRAAQFERVTVGMAFEGVSRSRISPSIPRPGSSLVGSPTTANGRLSDSR